MIAVLLVFSSFILEARLPNLIPYRKGELWGYSDSTKRIVIQPQWDKVSLFGGASAAVCKDNRWGLIDTSGKLIVGLNYTSISAEWINGVRIVQKQSGNSYGAMDDKGKLILPLEYENIWWAGKTLMAVKNCYMVVYDSTGRELIPYGKYRNCGDCPQNMADSGLFPMCYKQKWGVVDTTGNVIIPFQYWWIEKDVCENFQAYDMDGNPLVFNPKGEQIATGYDSCSRAPWPGWHPPANGMMWFEDSNGKVGYYSVEGELIFPAQFCTGDNFQPNGLATIWVEAPGTKRGFAEGYIDKYGNKYWDD